MALTPARPANLPDFRKPPVAEAVLSLQFEPWVSTSTLPDVLARPEVITAAVEQATPTLHTIMIRRPEFSLDIQGSGPMPQAFMKSVQGVVDVLGLPPGWNSYSAKPIEPRNAIRAIRLLAEFLEPTTPPPIIVPTVRGGIQFEWHTKGINIEVYVDSLDGVSFYAERAGSGESQERPLAGHEHELNLWLQRISE